MALIQKNLTEQQVELINNVETCDLLFTKESSWINKIISWKTKSPFGHVAFIYRITDSRLGVKIPIVIEAIRKGVIIKPLALYMKDFRGEIYVTRHVDVDEEKRVEMVEKALSYIGLKYDFDQLFSIFINKGVDNDNKLICSELVDLIYSAAGIELIRDHGCATPASIIRDQNLVFVGSCVV